MAEQADIHELYEESVQNVENEVEFLQNDFSELTGRTAHLFREDFLRYGKSRMRVGEPGT